MSRFHLRQVASYRSLSFVLVAMLSLTGCSKEAIDLDRLPGSWKLVGLESDTPYDWNGDGVTETDIYAVFTACEKNKLLQLEDGGVGKAKSSCSDSGHDIRWYKATNAGTSVHIEETFFSGKYTILTLTKKKLVMKMRPFSWEPMYHTYTFSGQ